MNDNNCIMCNKCFEDFCKNKTIKKKLEEECNEFIESLNINKNNIIEECADVLEVIENILKLYNITFDNVFLEKNKKKIKNGTFCNRHILIKD